MKDKAFIHLPDGTRYELENLALGGKFSERNLSDVRELFSTSTSVSLNIIVDGRLDCLILWGETLKNSYLTIERPRSICS